MAANILQEGCTTLAVAFQLASPAVTYTAEWAKWKLLQMPLMCIVIGDPSRNTSWWSIMWVQTTPNLVSCRRLCSVLHRNRCQILTRLVLRCCLVLVSRKEKKPIWSMLFARHQIYMPQKHINYGFQNMAKTFSKVEEAVIETKYKESDRGIG